MSVGRTLTDASNGSNWTPATKSWLRRLPIPPRHVGHPCSRERVFGPGWVLSVTGRGLDDTGVETTIEVMVCP